MEISQQIEDKLSIACQPVYLKLANESHLHAGPATDSHFKLTLTSTLFEGMSLVKRHQFIYRILKDELAGPVHALALHLYAPDEWSVQENVPDSPLCAGQNK